jgi:pyrimidine operon attenuation protein / uracil phosphoribosyltransferase
MSLSTVLTGPEVERALRRIAHEILEANSGAENLLLLGIPTRGVALAARIASELKAIEGTDIAHGSLDITMYRDDLAQRRRAIASTEVPLRQIDDLVVVLVDDVLFSGRSVRAALNALADIGRPKQIKLAVLVDRGHRELPIRPDFVGKNLPTSLDERVTVRLTEHDGEDGVVISK